MWIWLFACTAAPTESDTDVADTDVDTSQDPRYDRANWPVEVGGDRPASVVYPEDWDEKALPLVILLHGYGATGVVQDGYFGLSARADRGFVVVRPDGTLDRNGSRFWNATDACCDFANTGVDDVAYVTGLIDEMQANVAIDPDRVVLVGHSNGGFMSYRMACDRSDRLAGIASLAGVEWLDQTKCDEAGPVDVLHMHGTDDDTILYGGAANYPSAEETVARWAKRDGCSGDLGGSTTADFERRVPGEETSVLGYADCDVTLWKMQDSGHIPTLTDAWKDALVDWVLASHR